MLSFTQQQQLQLQNIYQIMNFHQPVHFDTSKKNESASINQDFQQKDIWGKIQGFASDHGDFRVKDINNFVRKKVANRIRRKISG